MPSDVPETIIWIITSKCNLNCKHCYTKPYIVEKDLPTNTIFRVIKEAAEVGVKHIHFTGGEPLLRNDMLVILKETIDYGIDATLFTNLTLINKGIAKSLSKLNIFIYTSMEGHVKEIYELVRGPGTWDKFLKGFHLLLNAGLPIHVNIAITELNWKFIDEVVKKAVELGAYSISVIPAMPVGNALKYGIYVRSNHLVRALKTIADVAKELGIIVGVWCIPFTGIISKSPYLAYGNCRDWDVMDISPSGKVIICDIMNYPIGDVLKLGIRKSWELLKSNPLVKKAEKPKLKPPCNICEVKYFCRGGCFARAWLKHGSTEEPDPLCPLVSRNKTLVKLR